MRILPAVFLASLAGLPLSAEEPITVDPAGQRVAEIFLGAISSDGRFFSHTDWSTGDLAVRDLETGDSRRLTQKGTWESPEFAQAVQAFSPDGRHVAYGWQGMSSCDLRIVGVGGSDSRVLHRDDEIANILPKDWSEHGQQILAIFARKDGTDQMVLVSVADGSMRVLKTFDAASGSGAGHIMALSPDGRFVAYDDRSDPDSPERDIHVLSVDGSRDFPLVEHAANDYMLGWTPDGSWVLFASDREGTLDAWGIKVVDGQPRGLPERVRSNIPHTEWGMFTREGSYYYARVLWENDVYLTTIDPETSLARQPQKLVDHVGFNTSAEWSPDGRYLAYATGAGRYPDPFVLGIRTLETGEDVRFRLEMARLGGHAFDPHWSPDGKALLGSGRQGIRRIDARTGEVDLLVGSPGGCPGGGECIEWPVWASDGRAIFTRFDNQGLPRRIAARDLGTGREEELYRVNPPAAVSQLAVSRDGQHLAFAWSDTATGASALMVIPTAARAEPRELLSLPPPERKVPGFDLRRGAILRPAWSPDGRHVFFTTIEVTRDGWGFKLWRIRADGKAPQDLGLVMEGLRPYGLSVHPDGRRIAITAGTPRRHETWVMEELLVRHTAAPRQVIE
jgi:Tol biopolymer transport system component